MDFKYSDALKAADNLLTFKMTVKSIAKRHGLHATFMPKPRSGVDGSGMHINMFLLDQDGRNVFYDREDPDHLSAEGRHFMAGILNHISGSRPHESAGQFLQAAGPGVRGSRVRHLVGKDLLRPSEGAPSHRGKYKA